MRAPPLLAGAVRLLLRASAMFALWLVLTDNPATPELLTGAVVAVGAALAAAGVARGDRLRPRLRPAMLLRLHRPFVLLVSDSVRVTAALLREGAHGRRLGGRFRHEPYTATGDDGIAQASRMLSEWGASLGPNRYVIGVDREAQELLVHELVPAPGPLDPLELG